MTPMRTDHHYIGHNYIGHNYIGPHYIAHNYMGLNCIGHNYIGHNDIGYAPNALGRSKGVLACLYPRARHAVADGRCLLLCLVPCIGMTQSDVNWHDLSTLQYVNRYVLRTACLGDVHHSGMFWCMRHALVHAHQSCPSASPMARLAHG